jgi:hypothetical protein
MTPLRSENNDGTASIVDTTNGRRQGGGKTTVDFREEPQSFCVYTRRSRARHMSWISQTTGIR